jgi:catechol 2,3-dioxygenase-like lactoylglutathione lyase family enzyme
MGETPESHMNGIRLSQIGGDAAAAASHPPETERRGCRARATRSVPPGKGFDDGLSRVYTIERMAIQRMDHVGIVVDDLADAVAFFVELGLELRGEAPVEGDWVDRVVGLEGVRAQIAMLQAPDGHTRVELAKFHAPSTSGGSQRAPANDLGIRHVAFVVDDIDAVVARLRARGAELVGEVERYQDSYRLCYVRGPEGIIVELAEPIG